jgi:hypothetical protein
MPFLDLVIFLGESKNLGYDLKLDPELFESLIRIWI